MAQFHREQWVNGETAWFEYHCLESMGSSDAVLWLHSHQQVIVGVEVASDAWASSTFEERAEGGSPRYYKIRFADGFEGTAFEDELMTGQGGFYRPDPPQPTVE